MSQTAHVLLSFVCVWDSLFGLVLQWEGLVIEALLGLLYYIYTGVFEHTGLGKWC